MRSRCAPGSTSGSGARRTLSLFGGPGGWEVMMASNAVPTDGEFLETRPLTTKTRDRRQAGLLGRDGSWRLTSERALRHWVQGERVVTDARCQTSTLDRNGLGPARTLAHGEECGLTTQRSESRPG